MTNPHDPYGGQGYPPHPQQQQQQQQGWGYQPQQQQQQWGQQPQQQQQQQWGHQPQWQQQQQQPQWQQQPQPYQMPGQAQPAYGQQYDADPNAVASQASPQARAKFIERTYLHLAGAIAVFIVLETIIQFLPFTAKLSHMMIFSHEYAWAAVLVGFMAVSYIADKWATGSHSAGMQYAGLLLYTVAEAVIFMPLIYLGLSMGLLTGNDIMMAGVVTMAMFAAMTAYVFITKKDFSFMRGILGVLGMAALGLVFGSIFFGFTLGLAFVIGMIVFACGYILYYTSNVLHHYRVNQHVAAALALFSAVALLFWYVLRLFMRR